MITKEEIYRRHKLYEQQKNKKIRQKNFAIAASAFSIVLIITSVIIITVFGKDEDKIPDAKNNAVHNINTYSVTADIETEPVTPAGLVSYAEYTDQTRMLSTEVDSEYAILIDVENNTVLASKGGDKKIYPASMTKILTLIVAYEHCSDLDGTYEMSSKILSDLYIENASVAGFMPGEKCKIRDLMYGLILPSGADCACALAEYTAGSEAAFVDMMNEKVAELGLEHSHFTNPTGLHDKNQYSTCHDIAKILEYAARDEFLREVLSTYKYQTSVSPENPEGVTLYSTMQTRMVGDEAKGMYILGGKTGYTTEARNCLASYAVKYDEKNDTVSEVYKKAPEYIFVTAGGGSIFIPVFDAINMYATIINPNALETRFYGK